MEMAAVWISCKAALVGMHFMNDPHDGNTQQNKAAPNIDLYIDGCTIATHQIYLQQRAIPILLQTPHCLSSTWEKNSVDQSPTLPQLILIISMSLTTISNERTKLQPNEVNLEHICSHQHGLYLISSTIFISWVTEFAQPYIHADVWSVLCVNSLPLPGLHAWRKSSQKIHFFQKFPPDMHIWECISLHPSHKIPFSDRNQVMSCVYN